MLVDGINRQLPEVLAHRCCGRRCGPRCVLRWRQAYLRSADHDAAMEQSRTAGATEMLAGQALEMSGMLILAMPGMCWQRASFYCSTTLSACRNLRRHCDFHQCVNGDPLRAEGAENPMRDITARYSMLCQSLGMKAGRA